MNTEERVQASKLAFFPPEHSQEDARALRDVLWTDVEQHAAMEGMDCSGLDVQAPHLCKVKQVQPTNRVLGADSVLLHVSLEMENNQYHPPVDSF